MDLLLLNGKILTVDKANPTAQAVAVKNGKIAKVGKNEEIQELIDEETEVIDLKGKTVLPGFIDAHVHPALGTAWAGAIDCSFPKVKSIAEILEKIEERVQKVSPGEWIKGVSYDQQLLAEKRHPNRWEIDEVAPNNPVALRHTSVHMFVYNSKALELAGVTEETPDPRGGKIERATKSGEPTGLLCEAANYMMRKVIPIPSVDEIRDFLRKNLEDMMRYGITTVCDMSTAPQFFEAYQELLTRDELPLRVSGYFICSEELGLNAATHLSKLGLHRGFGNDRLKIAGVKFLIDGALTGQTAALYEPYVGEPENRGILYTFMSSDEMHKWVKAAHDCQLQVAIHAIGDRAIDEALNIFDAALRENPAQDHRHRIEHCTLCTPKQLERIKQLGIIPGSNMGFIGEGGDVYEALLGEDRAQWIMPAKSYIDNDIISSSGSDYPAALDYNPLFQIQSAATRKTPTGKVLNPNQRISVMEAIEMLTINGAYAIFEEDHRGSIEPGKLADLVILSEDPLEVPVEEIKNIKVLMTIVGGKKVYSQQTDS